MKNILLFLFAFSFSSLHSTGQTLFTDGFETGNISHWDTVGNGNFISISNSIHHTGSYSVKFSVSDQSVYTGVRLIKNIAECNYLKIDYYVYVSSWDPSYTNYETFATDQIGNTWGWQAFKTDQSYLFDCNYSNAGVFDINNPLNQWNHVVIEKSSNGTVSGWVNDVKYIDNISIGACSSRLTWIGVAAVAGHEITVYMDDVSLTYNPIGIKNISTEQPNKYELFQNYPNPFNPVTMVKYQIPRSSFVTLKIYDILGNEIAELVTRKQDFGTYAVDFDASALASGIYFCTLTAGEFTETKKIVLVK